MQGDGTSTPRMRGAFTVNPKAIVAAAWGSLLLGAAADLFATDVGLRMGFYEQNPLARHALGQAGVMGLAAVKALGVVFAGLGSILVWHLDDRLWLYVPAGTGAVWAAVALWNALLIAGVIA